MNSRIKEKLRELNLTVIMFVLIIVIYYYMVCMITVQLDYKE